ncbi:YIP1 family protein [Archangium violaceum]|uniref:YIP1 family protein n=1 Tax=Archangium violaceum TaxID=83451 RepID=UPI00193B5386|nr:YIP1 family protein [Archangium violaceum]QRK09655.1 YIP1 family protein [Archangium violaceum]
MSIPCPRCQSPFTPGATSCPGCGSSLLLEAVPGSTEPTCAVHPTLRGLATCERCGAFACAGCLRSGVSGEAVCEACAAREPNLPMPWDEREELGTLKAFWKTCVTVLLRPETFSRARSEGSASSSLLFVLLCSLPPFFVTGLTYLGMFILMPAMFPLPQKEGQPEVPFALMGMGMFVASILLGPVMLVAMTVINAGIDHLVLRMGNVTRGFQVTLRAHALSQAPWVLGVVPFIGAQVAPFWALVARVFAYRGLHRTTWGVAVAGALLGPALFCFLCGGSYMALILFAASQLGGN